MKNRICTVCVRKGSKGVPGKNLRSFLGKPLIAHTLQQAKRSNLFEAIAVSSDCTEILQVAKENGADILVERPQELATDESPKLPAIVHCFREVEKKLQAEFQTIVDLDVTSPLRWVSDVIHAVDLLEKTGCPNVITGCPAHRSPYFNLVEEKVDGYVELAKEPPHSVMRRQDSPRCYDMNASIYVWRRDVLLTETRVILPKTRLYPMPENRSYDIDTELDLEWVEFLAKREPSHA